MMKMMVQSDPGPMDARSRHIIKITAVPNFSDLNISLAVVRNVEALSSVSDVRPCDENFINTMIFFFLMIQNENF